MVRRAGATTALLVDLVGPPGERRLLEDTADDVLLRAGDVRASELLLHAADAVLVQLQQPGPAVTAALDSAAVGALVVADGAPADDDVRRRVLDHADVVRADTAETEALVGWAPSDVPGTVRAAESLLEQGPRVVALAAAGEGDVVAWRGGHVVLPQLGEDPVDPTGGGDAFVAALTVGLLRGEDPETAAWWAAAAAAQVVGTAGGRPDLALDRLRAMADCAREA